MSENKEVSWEVVDHPAYPSFKVLRGPSFTVSVVMAATDLTFDDYLRRDADLKLMAAAPDLLRACRKALYAIKGREHDGFLREAITKATGEQP